MDLRCVNCGGRVCSQEPGASALPAACPESTQEEVLARVRRRYAEDEETRRLAVAAAQVEAEGYCRWPRAQEVMAFAGRMAVKRLGIACCVGLVREARLLQEILEANGFEVASVVCKVGRIPKEEVGLAEEDKLCPGQFEALCNPVGQAELLNAAGTGLNIVVGLCVGHDSLFFRHSQAPVTVLVAKDRVTGHNPVAALYTSHSYYRRLRQGA
ncbi:MAG: DUF1847 domain-containing protein [Anaerolineae bacterium]